MRHVWSVATSCLCIAAASGRAQPGAPGPDLIVGDIFEVKYQGTAQGLLGFSLGAISCNVGTDNVMWVSGSPSHPVVSQNLYRLRNGRLKQIGQAWVKHAFYAGSESLCSACTGGGGSVLGVGCSDPYTAAHNASQYALGPRSDINATTGQFQYPFTLGWQTTGDAIYKRCQVVPADVQDSTALYFAEAQYVTADDANAGNGLNNASYRRMTVDPVSFAPTMQAITERTKPAIWAWKDNGLGAGVPDPDVSIVAADYTEQGQVARFWVAAKATNNGDGTWHYEYAVENLNSYRSAGSFSVPVAPGTIVTNIGWHGVPCHSGDIYDNTSWTGALTGGMVVFKSPQTFGANPNSNALRWGTLYNFWFDARLGPQQGTASIGLFRPGSAGEPAAVGAAVPVPGVCYPNCDNSTTPPVLNTSDFACFLQKFAAGDPYANCDGSTLPPVLNIYDFTCFQQRFAAGCP